ncbi:MAG: ASKHA domain-containing protein [Clostridia bacterium]|nr:ASKHA domain-containing protein [Clostridia bacterium]
MDYTVKIHKDGSETVEKVKEGTNLLRFLQKNNIDVSAPCGGKGTCGKCKVRIAESLDFFGKEKNILGTKKIEEGYRLACYHKIESDLELFLDKKLKEAKILSEIKKNTRKIEPVVKKVYTELKYPGVNDQQADYDRILSFAQSTRINDDLDFIREIPQIIRKDNFKTTLVYFGKKLMAVEAGDTTGKLFGVAMDIGTTTVVGYLMNLLSGEVLSTYSFLNPQAKFGADVISRIDYASREKEGLEQLNRVIVDKINKMISHFTLEKGVKEGEIYTIFVAGNTTMLHLLLGISPHNLSVAPFIPVTTEMHKVKARELGIHIHPLGVMLVLPGVSAYIGADTLAAILSSGIYKKRSLSLLIDLGTNGEMVLGSKKGLYACSTAAGPAFEGANIRNGVGGVKGAIDRVYFKNGIELSTLGNQKACGLCGSGIVDAVSGLLFNGLVDSSGKMVQKEKTSHIFKERIVELDGIRAFKLVDGKESVDGEDIVITQRDIREVQNAKAAIAAGIRILVKEAGVTINDIDKVYLAGGFGSYIDIENAIHIGIIPKELRGKVESIGNAAGEGAVQSLLSANMLNKLNKIKKRIHYVELSASVEFMEEFVEAMGFEN